MDKLVEKLQKQVPNTCVGQQEHGKLKTNDPPPKPLIVKKTMCYIVCAVVIEGNKVLMMREAKKSCRGLWYLPAGRVEPNETLVEATKREVLEETGLVFEPTSLVCVEAPSLDWMRFNFMGRIIGGKLKTLENQDKESMEAGWYPVEEVISRNLALRAGDIIPVIKTAKTWLKTKDKDPLYSIFPQLNPYPVITLKVVVVAQNENEMKVLIDKEKMGILEISPTSAYNISLSTTVLMLVKKAFTGEHEVKIVGVIRAEHSGGPEGIADGCCLTLLTKLQNLSSLEQINSSYFWQSITDKVTKTELMKLCDQGCVELLKY